jgi:anti-sigma B factor antagonist
MEINKTVNLDTVTIALNGRLDTSSAPELEAYLNENVEENKKVIIDCKELSYVSSAGLRVFLSLQKKMKDLLKFVNVQELVMEVFEMTGFCDILTIE